MTKELYRIKEGEIRSEGKSLGFSFGIAYEKDGVIFFDLYVKESYEQITDFEFWHYKEGGLSLRAETVDLNLIQATELNAVLVRSKNKLVTLRCTGRISHRDMDSVPIDDEPLKPHPYLFYLELEGMDISFCDETKTITERQGVVRDDDNNRTFDHTNVRLNFQTDPETPRRPSLLVFNKHPVNNTVVVSFPGSRVSVTDTYEQRGSGYYDKEIRVSYEDYQGFKADFIHCLALLNGAEVLVRREYIGGYVAVGAVDSQTVITYSTKTIHPGSRKPYALLRDDHRNWGILSTTLRDCFPAYIRENQVLDLNSIIFYLNGSGQAQSIEEKFFILIIAFERLALKYVRSIEDGDSFVIPNEVYDPIKKELLEVLKRHEAELGTKLNTLSSLIGELNRVKRTSTQYKFIKLLERAQIETTPAINHIIQQARHVAVHEGEIGEGDQGYENYWVLHKLLRNIVLNIIGYKSKRSL